MPRIKKSKVDWYKSEIPAPPLRARQDPEKLKLWREYWEQNLRWWQDVSRDIDRKRGWGDLDSRMRHG